jgi:hypothetical protein
MYFNSIRSLLRGLCRTYHGQDLRVLDRELQTSKIKIITSLSY